MGVRFVRWPFVVAWLVRLWSCMLVCLLSTLVRKRTRRTPPSPCGPVHKVLGARHMHMPEPPLCTSLPLADPCTRSHSRSPPLPLHSHTHGRAHIARTPSHAATCTLQCGPQGLYTEAVDLFSAGMVLLALAAHYYVHAPHQSKPLLGSQKALIDAGGTALLTRGSSDRDLEVARALILALVSDAPRDRGTARTRLRSFHALQRKMKVGRPSGVRGGGFDSCGTCGPFAAGVSISEQWYVEE